MGRVSTCQKNCNTIDLRRAQVNECYNIMFPGELDIQAVLFLENDCNLLAMEWKY